MKDIRDEKRIADENSRDAGLTTNEEIERVMKGTLDRLHTEMDGRFARKVSIKHMDIYMMDKPTINSVLPFWQLKEILTTMCDFPSHHSNREANTTL